MEYRRSNHVTKSYLIDPMSVLMCNPPSPKSTANNSTTGYGIGAVPFDPSACAPSRSMA